MKKKLYITRTIKLIAFALALLSVTYLLQAYVLKRNDNNTLRMDGFYLEDKNSLDVVLIGASDVYAGFASPLAYDKYYKLPLRHTERTPEYCPAADQGSN